MSEHHNPLPQKKPYATPTLLRYGDVRAITRATSNTGQGDGAMAGLQKKS